MNIKQNVLMNILIIFVIITTNFFILINSVKAVNISEISQIELHSRGNCGQLLKYKGVIVKTTYVEYTFDGKNYPAYCLDKTLPGITNELVYSVGTNKKIEDVGLWRVIVNGFPYKTLSELGVANEEEAFTATKHAVYCYLFENTPNDYEAIGEAGQRTLNALKRITENANNSKEIQEAINIKINADSEEWIEDDENHDYIYKTYTLKSNISNLDYEIISTGDMPEGSLIKNEKGNETLKFSNNEKIKVLLLKDSLASDGNIKMNIKTKIKTKPVIYGSSPNSSWQNYALTGYMYEDVTAKLEDTYKKVEKPVAPEKVEKIEVKEIIKTENVRVLPVTGM